MNNLTLNLLSIAELRSAYFVNQKNGTMKPYIKNGKVTMEGIARYAEAMRDDQVEDLPDDLYRAVQDDDIAFKKTLKLYKRIVGKRIRIEQGLLARLEKKFPSHERHRSVAFLGETDIKLKDPPNETVCVDQIEFYFSSPLSNEALFVDLSIILENQKSGTNKGFNYSIRGDNHTVVIPLPRKEFPSGRYNWLIKTKKGLQQSGYFFKCTREEIRKLTQENT